MKYTPLLFCAAKTHSIRDQRRLAHSDKAGKPFIGGSFRAFLDSLPDFLGAQSFKNVASAIVSAVQTSRPVILGMGAHPIKVGLSPIIIHLIEKGVISAICLNGACMVHDFELAYAGQTSEDVAAELTHGAFGMTRETGELINQAINDGVSKGLGLGQSIGLFISNSRYPFKNMSIFAAAFERQIPATVHVAIGTDIIHMHPQADGGRIGEGSLKDFRLLASVVANMEGGVYINLGSAVILPEVFLKALNIARNLGNTVQQITTVNMDFIQHYRPAQNILARPTQDGGKGYALTGHHEIMFPLLAAAILEQLNELKGTQ